MKRKLLLIVASLLFSGAMFAQEFYWDGFDYHDYQTHMDIKGRAYFDGELQSRPNIEIATFVDGELRGTKYLVEPYPNALPGEYYVWNACYYDTEGETFTFKAYDHDSDIEYDLCDVELIGQQNGHGTMDNPLQMHFTRTVEPTYGPEYPWIPSTAYSGEGMMVTAQIQINGQLVDRATYEVGAFCGDECRGTSLGEGDANLVDFTDVDMGYFAFMNVMGNNGDIINFYLYDKENSCIIEGVCNTIVTLQNGGEIGTDVINDLFVLNFVSEYYTKDIIGYVDESNAGRFYLIASPIGEVSPANVTNMLNEAGYDLYYFDQAQDLEWINYKGDQANGNPGGFNLEPGKGYLYANHDDVTLYFNGAAYNDSGYVTLVRDDSETTILKGWNLVGNPFAETAYIEGGRDFYVMNEAGTEITPAERNYIEAMEGIFVVPESDGEVMTFTTTEPNKGREQIVVNVNRNRGTVIDRAIIRFDEEDGLPKFQIGKNSTKLYIPENGMDYAVVNAEAQGEIALNFRAAENGVYTLSINTEEVKVNYLHLIDNMAGTDTDLLANPSYSFEAKKSDYPTRFKLVFATGNNSDDNFAFFSDGNWIISNEGEATLQVVDALGRILSSETISGSCSKAIHAAPGVYMLRLINGDNMKVQKVVVE